MVAGSSPFHFLSSYRFLCHKEEHTTGNPIGRAYLPLKASLNFMFTSGSPSWAVFLPLVSAHKRHWGCKEVQQMIAWELHTFTRKSGVCTVPVATHVASVKEVCDKNTVCAVTTHHDEHNQNHLTKCIYCMKLHCTGKKHVLNDHSTKLMTECDKDWLFFF